MEIPMKRYWMGEDVDNMPREKLLEIIGHLAKELESARSLTQSVIDMNRMVRAAQEPLGGEFQRVLDEHRWNLYARS